MYSTLHTSLLKDLASPKLRWYSAWLNKCISGQACCKDCSEHPQFPEPLIDSTCPLPVINIFLLSHSHAGFCTWLLTCQKQWHLVCTFQRDKSVCFSAHFPVNAKHAVLEAPKLPKETVEPAHQAAPKPLPSQSTRQLSSRPTSGACRA